MDQILIFHGEVLAQDLNLFFEQCNPDVLETLHLKKKKTQKTFSF